MPYNRDSGKTEAPEYTDLEPEEEQEMNTRVLSLAVLGRMLCRSLIPTLSLLGAVGGAEPALAGPLSVAQSERMVAGRRDDAPLPPGLLYLARLAGPGTENAWDLAVDSAGNAYIAGMTDSFGLAGLPGILELSRGGSFDAFVVKLEPDGSFAYAVLFGGSGLDQASKIAVDPLGSAYVAGYTSSSDFPTTPGAYDRSYNGGGIDAFVAKLSPDGSELAYSTFLGGNADDYGASIAVDDDGHAFFTGYTESPNFPATPGAFDTSHNGINDVVVAKLNPDGSDLVYSSFAGGNGIDIGYDIAVDMSGRACVTGQTMSLNFPTTQDAFRPDYNGGSADAFVLALDQGGQALVYGTYLGGNQFDDAKGIAVNAAGEALVAGRTESFNFPTTQGAFDRSYNGGRDSFVTKLAADGAALVHSTFVGGGGEEESGAIALGPYGTAFVAGWTFSSDFPITGGAFDPTHNGDYDAFLIVLGPAGGRLLYASFLGTPLTDYGRGIGTDPAGHAYLAGYSGFENVDAFAVKLDLIGNGAR